MAAKARITADFATPSEVASRLGVSPARAADLRRQVFDLQLQKADTIAFVSGKARREQPSGKTATMSRSVRSKKK